MLRSRELVPIVHNGVIGEGVESIVRSPDIVEEDPTVPMLQDRLELLLGMPLVERLNSKVPFGRNVVVILPLADPIDVMVPASTPAPTFLLLPV